MISLMHVRPAAVVAAFTIVVGCNDQSPAPAAPAAVPPVKAASNAKPSDVEKKQSAVPAAHVVAPPQPLPRSAAANNPAGWPAIEFEPREFQFGVLPPDGKGRGKARLFNVGSQPLKITVSQGSCSCIEAPNLVGQVIPPGGAIEFTVGMTMKSGLGEKHQRVVLFFAGHDTPVFFDLRAEVSLPVRTLPPYLTATDSLTGQIELTAVDGRPFRILSAHGKPPRLANNAAPNQPMTSATLLWDLTEEDVAGAVPWFWVIETDREDCELIDVRVRHPSTAPARNRQRPWEPADQRLLLGSLQPSRAVTATTHLEYRDLSQRDPKAVTVSSDSPNMAVELLSAVPEGRNELAINLRLTPLQDKPGLLCEPVSITANGHTIGVWIIGKIDQAVQTQQ